MEDDASLIIILKYSCQCWGPMGEFNYINITIMPNSSTSLCVNILTIIYNEGY